MWEHVLAWNRSTYLTIVFDLVIKLTRSLTMFRKGKVLEEVCYELWKSRIVHLVFSYKVFFNKQGPCENMCRLETDQLISLWENLISLNMDLDFVLKLTRFTDNVLERKSFGISLLWAVEIHDRLRFDFKKFDFIPSKIWIFLLIFSLEDPESLKILILI